MFCFEIRIGIAYCNRLMFYLLLPCINIPHCEVYINLYFPFTCEKYFISIEPSLPWPSREFVEGRARFKPASLRNGVIKQKVVLG